MPVVESLASRVLAESGLRVAGLTFLGVARTTFGTDPLGHGAGTDTVNLMYAGTAEGEISLDRLHSSPTLFTATEYHETMRQDLHPYVVEIVDLALAGASTPAAGSVAAPSPGPAARPAPPA